jgi:hypothetical protein
LDARHGAASMLASCRNIRDMELTHCHCA